MEGTPDGGAPTAEEPQPTRPAELLLGDARRLAGRRAAGDLSPIRTVDPDRLRHAVLAAFAEELRSGGMDGVIHSERELVAAPGGPPDADPATVLAMDRPISERPHAWNGRLRDPVVLAALRERFTTEYPWSASQLETYGRRPFDFLLERVLRLGEVEEAEEETSPLAFGSVAHALLQCFYERLRDDLPRSYDARAAATYERVAAEVFGRFEADLERWLGLPPLWAVRREEVREKVREYLEWELPWLAENAETPLLVEHEFGTDGEVRIEGADVRKITGSLRVRGRIDRVDRLASGGLRVIDYKSSRIPTCGGTRDGALLQGALYLKALQPLGLGAPESAVYRAIKRPGNPQNGCEVKARGVDIPLSFALSIPERVRAGLFEAVQACSTRIEEWQPGREIVRTAASIGAGHRFQPLAE